jgi:K(+)-stimulated pyrophosphate-energized sodium pump
MFDWLLAVPFIGLAGLLLALILSLLISKSDPGTPAMVKISHAIRQGAYAFLFKEYQYMAFAIIPFGALVIWITGWYSAAAFACGAIFSVLAGFFGMNVATLANTRTAQAAASKGVGKALEIAFSGGSVMGLIVSSLGVIGISLIYIIFEPLLPVQTVIGMMIGFSVGASFVALFARVGGGIFTKAADVGADLVGKVEANIPEDDPRNPAVIADNVGDNVGDIAGMGADLYESYVGAIVSAIVISVVSNSFDPTKIKLILFVIGAGLFSSILGIVAAKITAATGKVKPAFGLQLGTIISTILCLGSSLWISFYTMGSIGPFLAIASGLIAGVLIGIVTTYYTSAKPVNYIADQSTGGPATNIIAGLGVGFESSVFSIIFIAAALFAAYKFEGMGMFGTALAGVGMLSTLATTLAVDAYGPIADNAGGIAQMSGLPHEVRGITDSLDSLGNTTAAMGKGVAIGSAAITALALFSAYTHAAKLTNIDLLNINVLAGAFVGIGMPVLFSALTLKAVGLTANLVVIEVRRQFKEIAGLLNNEADPDYRKIVSITTNGGLKKMILPAILMVAIPFIVYYTFGAQGVGGMLAGSTLIGVILAIFMANAGGAWDNAKKLIESGYRGGKGTSVHHATIVGDTVGDPLKDTTGPSLNILIKLMAVISLLFIPFLIGM